VTPLFTRMSDALWQQFTQFCEELGMDQCPVCGYYCNGNGANGCIDKPYLQECLDKGGER